MHILWNHVFVVVFTCSKKLTVIYKQIFIYSFRIYQKIEIMGTWLFLVSISEAKGNKNIRLRNNRVEIKGSWIVNQESISWSHELKICQDKIISVDNICDALRDFGSVTILHLQGCSSTCQCMLTLCIVHNLHIVFIHLYELAWHSNGSIKCQTFECHSKG